MSIEPNISKTFMDTQLPLFSHFPYKVRPLENKTFDETATFGRKEIELAEHEMPGLMALRTEFAGQKPLAGAKIMGSLHMTIQTAVLIETLTELGADVRWVSCNIFSTQDHAAVAVVAGQDGKEGTPVFAWKRESLSEYWWCTLQALVWADGTGPNLILDDGGDATLLIHDGVEFERTGVIPSVDSTDNAEYKVVLSLLHEVRKEKGDRFWHELSKNIRGVSEETTTGVHRLIERMEKGSLLFPAINVNDSVTKSKFDNVYGCRHSLVDAIMRATDVLISGKRVLVCGYGDVGKGSAESLRGQYARVAITEADPICALQACMMGFDVVRLESVVEKYDVFVTATGNKDIITAEHMMKMRHNAIVCNIGHFDNEIDIAGLEVMAEKGLVEKITIKEEVHEWKFKGTTHGPNGGGHSIIILAEGRLVNLGCATGHPSLVMSASFTNQTIAQIELHKNAEAYGLNRVEQSDRDVPTVITLPKHLDEKVARLHLEKFGAELTVLRKDQAEYIGVSVVGPYKPEHYRY